MSSNDNYMYLQMAIENGWDISKILSNNTLKEKFLRKALQNSDVGIIRFLIANIELNRRWEVLKHAANDGDTKVVENFLKYDEAMLRSNLNSPLFEAALNNRYECVELLLKAGATLNMHFFRDVIIRSNDPAFYGDDDDVDHFYDVSKSINLLLKYQKGLYLLLGEINDEEDKEYLFATLNRVVRDHKEDTFMIAACLKYYNKLEVDRAYTIKLIALTRGLLKHGNMEENNVYNILEYNLSGYDLLCVANGASLVINGTDHGNPDQTKIYVDSFTEQNLLEALQAYSYNFFIMKNKRPREYE
jgi:hypothetical protein